MKVLVVDDSAVMRKLVTRALRQAGLGAMELIEAEDGAAALACFDSERPDTILSDWNMPNMSGIELLTALRERGERVRFGFVTSESTADMRALAAQHGASFFITKPFTADDFATALLAVKA